MEHKGHPLVSQGAAIIPAVLGFLGHTDRCSLAACWHGVLVQVESYSERRLRLFLQTQVVDDTFASSFWNNRHQPSYRYLLWSALRTHRYTLTMPIPFGLTNLTVTSLAGKELLVGAGYDTTGTANKMLCLWDGATKQVVQAHSYVRGYAGFDEVLCCGDGYLATKSVEWLEVWKLNEGGTFQSITNYYEPEFIRAAAANDDQVIFCTYNSTDFRFARTIQVRTGTLRRNVLQIYPDEYPESVGDLDAFMQETCQMMILGQHWLLFLSTFAPESELGNDPAVESFVRVFDLRDQSEKQHSCGDYTKLQQSQETVLVGHRWWENEFDVLDFSDGCLSRRRRIGPIDSFDKMEWGVTDAYIVVRKVEGDKSFQLYDIVTGKAEQTLEAFDSYLGVCVADRTLNGELFVFTRNAGTIRVYSCTDST